MPTPLALLAARRAKPLRRTLPCWARCRLDDGRMEWRMYVPHPTGGALHARTAFDDDAMRSTVAAELRELRRDLFARRVGRAASLDPAMDADVPEADDAVDLAEAEESAGMLAPCDLGNTPAPPSATAFAPSAEAQRAFAF